MTTKTSPRWTRILDGWYSLNLRTSAGYTHLEVIRTELGLWNVKIDGESLGLVEKLAWAKAMAVAA